MYKVKVSLRLLTFDHKPDTTHSDSLPDTSSTVVVYTQLPMVSVVTRQFVIAVKSGSHDKAAKLLTINTKYSLNTGGNYLYNS